MTACSPALKEKFGFKSFADLDGRTLLVHENRPRSWENWAKALDIPPPRPGKVYRFDSMAAVVQAAAQGHGVALVSWPLSESWFKSGALVRALNDEVETGEKFYLAYRAEESEDKKVATLTHWIVEKFKSDK
jgi:DNA-binding transcriptional LysR family regulator